MPSDSTAFVGCSPGPAAASRIEAIADTPKLMVTRRTWQEPLTLFRALGGVDAWAAISGVLLARDNSVDFVVPLRARGTRWTFRVCSPGAEPVVLKVWRRSRMAAAVYRVGYRWTTAYREWAMPEKLAASGIRCAEPLCYFLFCDAAQVVYEAVVLEDLGECTASMVHLQRAVQRGDELEVARINELIVSATASLVQHRIVDSDHSMTNLVFTPDGSLARLDLEHCRQCNRLRWGLSSKACGEMLGVLIGTYAYAVQPREELAVAFGHELARRVAVPRTSFRIAQQLVHRMMDEQAKAKHIHTSVALGW